MSNETPQADGEPTESAPEAPVPEAAAPAVPQAASPEAATVENAVQSSGDEDDVAEAPPTVAAPAAPVAAPAAAAAATAPERPAGIFIPKWVGIVAAAIVAALVFGGIGYAIGDSSGGSNTRNATSFPGAANGAGSGQRRLPGGGNGPLGNGQRQLPGNGNGNGNSGGGGNSGGSGQTSGDTAFLGVALQNAANGAGITDVQSGSPAADAGLKTGDVITAVDGTNVTTAAAVASAIQQHSSGDQITVTYTRDGKSATAKVTLSSRSSAQSS
jgi:membrane-associated protease RseP (regulator of RpoE activity)